MVKAENFELESLKIAVIGLGYVGLPLALAFNKMFWTLGFDTDVHHVDRLSHARSALGMNLGVGSERLAVTCETEQLRDCNVFVIAVPTPVDKFHQPDLSYLERACSLVGEVLEEKDLVIFESTVYPGCTREICIPILEGKSNLKAGREFGVGYSPERVSPGDQAHGLSDVVKLVSGLTEFDCRCVEAIYQSIVMAGVYATPSIEVAEAAKVIENTQRDINIAAANEFSNILRRLGLDTSEVFDAAATKWNFHRYSPGLVGGHCISVDPYYLVSKSEQIGFVPELILAGRKVNEAMSGEVATLIDEGLRKQGSEIFGSSILVLGITFKANCSDMRNSKVLALIHQLRSKGAMVSWYDPIADLDQNQQELPPMISLLDGKRFDCVVIAVPHSEIVQIGAEKIIDLKARNGIVVDIASVFPKICNFIRL